MARRRSSKKKSSSISLGPIIGTACVILALVVVYAVFSLRSDRQTASDDVPLDVLSQRASQLANNQYEVTGTVIDRFPRGDAELISFLYTSPSSGEEGIIPICVAPETKEGLNINRNQQYRIRFKIKDVGKAKGICVAQSILPN